MKIVVGLGNPEAKYLRTFHNTGFMAVDILAESLGVSFNKNKCKAAVAEGLINGEKFIIAKPQTYMNLSGDSVLELVNFYKVDLSDILVIYDDYDLEIGSLRIRKDGSAGTHNGMRDIVKKLSSTEFKRIRVGIHDNDSPLPLLAYVLSNVGDDVKDRFLSAVKSASAAAKEFIEGKTIDSVMQKYNVKV